MFNRRDLLRAAGLLAVSPLRCASPRTPAGRILVNDIHAQLNPKYVDRIVPVDSLATIRTALASARRDRKSVCIAGGRHAMGGQQFGEDAVLLDLRPFRRVLGLDAEAGIVEVEAGIQWPDLVGWLLEIQAGRPRQWGIAQKQTGADRLSLGGALAANVPVDLYQSFGQPAASETE